MTDTASDPIFNRASNRFLRCLTSHKGARCIAYTLPETLWFPINACIRHWLLPISAPNTHVHCPFVNAKCNVNRFRKQQTNVPLPFSIPHGFFGKQRKKKEKKKEYVQWFENYLYIGLYCHIAVVSVPGVCTFEKREEKWTVRSGRTTK